jgi:predicted aspartyl protease
VHWYAHSRKFKWEVRVRRLRFWLWLALMCFTAASTAAERKPNFSGIWKLMNGGTPQIMIVEQNDAALRIVQFIEDRPAMHTGPIDGRPHPEIVDGLPCDFLARWEGNSLFFETRPSTHAPANRVADMQRLMRLAADGETISAKRTNVTPRPDTVHEKWEKQDPPLWDTFVSGFDDRRKLDDPSTGVSGAEGNRLRGWVAYAFNDVSWAEGEFLTIINQQPAPKFRDEARQNLVQLYARNGLMRKALSYCLPADRAFYQQLAAYPEVSVTHRGYARVQVTRDPDGRILLPVSAAGKDARYIVDTGTNNSLLSTSEAQRLGLRLEPLHRRITNGNVSFDGFLTIVPVLTVGETRLENAPFWVVPDARLEWPGILGIDLLLKVETLRWNAAGEGEIGFPAQEKHIRNANLCFSEDDVLADVSFNGHGHLVLFLDTGNNATKLYPRFAAGNLDLVTTSGKQSVEPWHSNGANGEVRQLTFSEITLTIGGLESTIRPAGVLLERAALHDKLQGTIGMDLLNAAQRVTLDLQAMRLTLE